jgi:hypothetical protein
MTADTLTMRARLVAIVSTATAVVVTVAITAPSARAQVLIDPPQKHLTTSGCITMGIWYQSYSGGPHTITASVYYRGRRKAIKRLRATTRWRDHVLYCPGYPNAGRWETRSTGHGWHATYVTHVVVDTD